MAGWSWENGKSNNAVSAERDGLMTAARIANRVAKMNRRLRGCRASDIEAVLPQHEWHHSSKFFNEVGYYRLDDIYEPRRRGAIVKYIRARAADADLRVEGVTVEWLEWGGSRSHPRAMERLATGCTVTRKSGTRTYTFTGGTLSYPLIKRAGTRGFRAVDATGKTVAF